METTYTARTADMSPHSYSAKRRSSRIFDMDDAVMISSNLVSIQRVSKRESRTASQSGFITDGYSPVAMQEQMMRWWLLHGKPTQMDGTNLPEHGGAGRRTNRRTSRLRGQLAPRYALREPPLKQQKQATTTLRKKNLQNYLDLTDRPAHVTCKA